MKKKVVYIACGAVILAALIGMLIFVFSGNDGEKTGEKDMVSLVGTWEVAAVVQNDVPTFVDEEFMVFDENKASNYRSGDSEPFASSSYEISADNKLILPDISRNYTIDKKTENYVRLYENADKYLLLVRYQNSDMSAVTVDKEILIGKWDVVYRAADEKFEEILEFSNDILNDYRNGSSEPVSTSAYTWQDDKTIFAEKWNKKYEAHSISDKIIVFIECDTGFALELQKAE